MLASADTFGNSRRNAARETLIAFQKLAPSSHLHLQNFAIQLSIGRLDRLDGHLRSDVFGGLAHDIVIVLCCPVIVELDVVFWRLQVVGPVTVVSLAEGGGCSDAAHGEWRLWKE